MSRRTRKREEVVPEIGPRGDLRARLPRRKLFVALAGNIGAGKTTAAKMISQAR